MYWQLSWQFSPKPNPNGYIGMEYINSIRFYYCFPFYSGNYHFEQTTLETIDLSLFFFFVFEMLLDIYNEIIQNISLGHYLIYQIFFIKPNYKHFAFWKRLLAIFYISIRHFYRIYFK